MRNVLIVAAAAASLAAAAAPHGAPSPHAAGPNSDVRCLLLSNLYAKAAAAQQGRDAAAQARLFYLGRVSGRLSGAQLQTAMSAATPAISPDQAGNEMNRCLATVQSAAAATEAAGNKVRGTIAGPKPAAGPTATPPAGR